MPIDLPPQLPPLLWRQGYVPGGNKGCSSVKRVCGSMRLGILFLVAGDGLFLFNNIWGHDGEGWGMAEKRPKRL